MMVVVAYDVNTETPEGKRRLRNVAKIITIFDRLTVSHLFSPCSLSSLCRERI